MIQYLESIHSGTVSEFVFVAYCSLLLGWAGMHALVFIKKKMEGKTMSYQDYLAKIAENNAACEQIIKEQMQSTESENRGLVLEYLKSDAGRQITLQQFFSLPGIDAAQCVNDPKTVIESIAKYLPHEES